MKKQTFCLCSILSASLFISASWWQQGDAKISQHISERGYYAATNSVPLNTLVDITNPENEKTIRVMVIDGLDDPSFLVTLSREAAEAIALPKTNAKVIMEQPSEEEAYSPFRVAGSPNTASVKPEAVIKEEFASTLAQGTLPLKQSLTPSAKEPSQTVETPVTEPNTTPQAASPENESADSDYKPAMPDVAITEDSARDPTPVWTEPMDQLGTVIPEISEATTSNETDIPVTISETPVTDLYNPETNLPDPMSTMADSETLPPDVMDEPELVSAPEPDPQSIATGEESPASESTPTDEPELVSAPEPEPKSAPQSMATVQGTIPSKDGTSEYKLIPTEDRPPEATTFTMLPPESEIAPLPSASLPDSFFGSSQNTSETASAQRIRSITQAVEPTKIPDSSLFVEPIDTVSRSAAPARVATPDPSSSVVPIAATPQQPTTASIDPSTFVEPVDTASRPAAPATMSDSSLFVEPIDTVSRSAAPARVATPDPSSFVAPITATPQQPTTASIDPSTFVEPVDTASRPAAPATTSDPSLFVEPIDTVSRSAAPDRVATPDPSSFVAPITATPQQSASSLMDTSAFVAPIAVTPQRKSGTSLFSIPTIASLEAGQYYLQVIAYNRLEQVESAVSNIGRAYPLTVQSAGTSENPIYRLLIGPLNLGESGA
ncbi:MAG: hypothetical protein LBC46_03410, partial [Treponema sp.]|nr:hypothetical protein [Treponema sp.]